MLFRRTQTVVASSFVQRVDAISVEVARLNRLSDHDLSRNGTDRVTLGAHVLKALHAL